VIQSSPPAGRQDTGLHGLAALRQRARLIAFVSAAGLCLGILSYANEPPRYVAEAVIALDVRRIQAMPIDQVVAPLPQENPVVRTELDMIASRDMAQRVIDMLVKDALSGEPALDMTSLISHASASQRVRALISTALGRVLGRAPAAPVDGGSMIEEALRGNLSVVNDGRSYTIYIAYSAGDPVVAARVANAYARAYLDYQDDLQIEATRRVSDWLEERLATLGAKLQKAEHHAERFRAASGLFEIEGVTIAAQRVSALSAELIAARAAYATAEARERTAAQLAGKPDGLDGFSDVLGSPIIQQLRVSQSALERKLQVLTDTGATRSVEVPVLTSELETVQQQIRREVDKVLVSLRNEIDTVGRRVASLEAELRDAEADYGGSDTARVKLEGLVREANADRAVFESLLGRAKQIGDRKELTDPGVRLISAASVPVHATGPRLLSALLLGLMGGATGGVGLALGLGRFDHRIRSRHALEVATGLPVLATLPALGGRHRRSPADAIVSEPHSPFSEAFATLQWMLQLSPSLRRASVLMVTSALSGEGKTTVVLALARSVAMAGRSVVLVSLDPDVGLVPRGGPILRIDEFAGTEAEDLRNDLPHGAILAKDSGTTARIIVPRDAGAMPTSLTNAQHFSVLMAALRVRFDLVLLDAPALAGSSKALQFGAEADALLFVARWGHTPQHAVASSVQRLAYCGLPVRALLLNHVPLSAHRRFEHPSGLPIPASPVGRAPGKTSGRSEGSPAPMREVAI
jgi:uncharacterized protein involved in exopolysaccharide biosynthesis/Mrp family chromosome partitioning ATPase